MTFYESVHCGAWRVQITTQYLWQWVRENKIPVEKVDIESLGLLVEDQLNMHSLESPVNVNYIIQNEVEKQLDEKQQI